VLPELTVRGVLPPGVHTATVEEIAIRYGRFQRTTRRPQLLMCLREFIDEARQCRQVRRLLLAGSFITASEEPNDLDILVVFTQHAEFGGLLPHEYNVLYQSGARRRFGPAVDLHVVEEGSEAMERLLRFFRRDRSGHEVGIVEIV
jgi:hypothetical protein